MKLAVASIFGEHMVLQRGKELSIFGTSILNDEITVTLHGMTLVTTTIKDKWEVKFPPFEAVEKTSLKVVSKKLGEKIEFEDIAIGEVWLAGGQSNMEFIVKYDVNAETLKVEEGDHYLRCFTVAQAPFKGFKEKEPTPLHDYWRTWEDPEERIQFSAVAMYMGKILRQKLQVPIGIISCNWGGTPALAWCDRETIKANPKFEVVLKWQQEALDKLNWASYINTSELPNPEPTKEALQFQDDFMMGKDMREFFLKGLPPMDPNIYTPYVPGPRACIRPSGLYESMLKPLIPYAIAGAIWYQGEDDDARDWVDFYDESMKAVITSWRKAWGEELPFFQVELAPFEGVGVTGAKRYDVLRHQQYKATSELDHAYDVCILDVGERYNIHPRRKEKVGRRLAHLAMKYVYGDTSLVADMPIVKEAKRVGDAIEIYFDHCAGGLEERLSLKDVLKVTQDGNPMDYSYELKGDTLVLQGDFKAKTLIQYCEGNFVEASLFNREDNPVFGFTLEV